MLRYDIIALHLANQFNGAEFYANCAQMRVGGSGTGGPKDNELVSLPGAYDDNEIGIFDPHLFDDQSVNYAFPGPPVASFVDGSSTDPNANDPNGPNANDPNPNDPTTDDPGSPSDTDRKSVV